MPNVASTSHWRAIGRGDVPRTNPRDVANVFGQRGRAPSRGTRPPARAPPSRPRAASRRRGGAPLRGTRGARAACRGRAPAADASECGGETFPPLGSVGGGCVPGCAPAQPRRAARARGVVRSLTLSPLARSLRAEEPSLLCGLRGVRLAPPSGARGPVCSGSEASRAAASPSLRASSARSGGSSRSEATLGGMRRPPGAAPERARRACEGAQRGPRSASAAVAVSTRSAAAGARRSARHASSWPCRSIFTGHTAVQLPHSEEACGSSPPAAPPSAGPSTLPIGPGITVP